MHKKYSMNIKQVQIGVKNIHSSALVQLQGNRALMNFMYLSLVHDCNQLNLLIIFNMYPLHIGYSRKL